MKKVLIVLGGVFVVLLLVAGAVFGAGLYFASSREGEAKAYVDQVLTTIVGTWSAPIFLENASPELLQSAPPEKVRPLLEMFGRRLGTLKRYHGAARETYFFTITTHGRVLSYTYLADAEFEHAPAKIRVRAIWRDGQWKLVDFFVYSDALLQG